MRAERSRLAGIFFVVCNEHAAFSRGHGFHRMEGERGDICPRVAADSKSPAVMNEPASRTVAGIFDDQRPTIAGHAGDGRHISGLPGIVHCHHRFGVCFPAGLE